ncbi:MAG: hypothetical protein ABI595_12295, partial [Actinomycetota bacterium]
MLSHVDNDHLIGLLDLFAELRQQRTDQEAETIPIDALWLNSFDGTIGAGTDIQSRAEALVAAGSPATMPASSMAVEGIGEGNSLRLAAIDLGVPLNPGFAGEVVCVDDLPAPVEIGDLVLRVVGPTRTNLEELRAQWLTWLETHEATIGAGSPQVA